MNKQFLFSAFADEYSPVFSEQLAMLANAGINFIELRFIDGKNIADLSCEEVSAVKDLLAQFRIGVSAIGSPLGKISLADDMDAHLEKAQRVFCTANALGAKFVRCFSFYPPEGRDIADFRDEVLKNMERLVRLSEEHGVTLCHENEANIYGETPERCLDLMQHFAGRMRCVFDMGNFVLDGCRPYPDALHLLRPYIAYFHIKDALAAGAIVPPGKGEACIPQILADFGASMPADTYISLEPHLQTFDGLNALVGKAFKNPYVYPDAHTAFDDAVSLMKGILETVNTRLQEENG